MKSRIPLGRYLWVAPNSLIGLAFVPAVLLARGGMRMVDGVLELHGPVIAWALRHLVPMPGGALALTFGHVVLGRDEEALMSTRGHERVHVRQYERWGPAFIPAYLIAALWGLATRAGAYRGNVFEREAMERDGAMRGASRRSTRRRLLE